MQTTTSSVAQRLEGVRARIAAACDRAGRDAATVTLIGVTKRMPADAVAAALAAGLTDIGENAVKEAAAKKAALHTAAGFSPQIIATSPQTAGPIWHLIGHLQRNKVRDALATFDVIHSVDSLRLAEEIDRRAAPRSRDFEAMAPAAAGGDSWRVPVLLEVNVAGEASKFGFSPAETAAAVSAVRRLPNLDLLGLMTVAPAVGDAELVRPVFRELRELAAANGLEALSMGMTDDFEVAIEEGATLVRVGRAIFGERTA